MTKTEEKESKKDDTDTKEETSKDEPGKTNENSKLIDESNVNKPLQNLSSNSKDKHEKGNPEKYNKPKNADQSPNPNLPDKSNNTEHSTSVNLVGKSKNLSTNSKKDEEKNESFIPRKSVDTKTGNLLTSKNKAPVAETPESKNDNFVKPEDVNLNTGRTKEENAPAEKPKNQVSAESQTDPKKKQKFLPENKQEMGTKEQKTDAPHKKSKFLADLVKRGTENKDSGIDSELLDFLRDDSEKPLETNLKKDSKPKNKEKKKKKEKKSTSSKLLPKESPLVSIPSTIENDSGISLGSFFNSSSGLKSNFLVEPSAENDVRGPGFVFQLHPIISSRLHNKVLIRTQNRCLKHDMSLAPCDYFDEWWDLPQDYYWVIIPGQNLQQLSRMESYLRGELRMYHNMSYNEAPTLAQALSASFQNPVCFGSSQIEEIDPRRSRALREGLDDLNMSHLNR